MSLDDDGARALLAELRDLSTTRLDAFVTEVRNAISNDAFDALPPRAATPLRAAETDLGALLAIAAPAVRRAALVVWEAAARAQIGARRAARAQARVVAATDPGRVDALGLSAQEVTKLGVLDDLVDVAWLAQGHAAAAAVGFVEITRIDGGVPGRREAGTAFLVDRDHVMTAYHVVSQRKAGEAITDDDLAAQLAGATLRFDYLARGPDDLPTGTVRKLDRVAVFDRDLDYAIVRLAAPAPAELIPLTLSLAAPPAPDNGLAVVANIIQHPAKEPKQLGLRNNAIWRVEDTKLFYFTDTRGGSSGAPVFNDAWRVIAVHTGWDDVSADEPIYMGRTFALVNRGTRITRIITHVGAAVALTTK